MRLWTRLICGALAATCFVVAQTGPAADSSSAPPAAAPPAQGAAAAGNRVGCPPGAAWFCVTQTLQRMIYNLNGTHRPDADIAAQVPAVIAQMIKDGVMKAENAPTSPIKGFDDVNKFLLTYPSDVPESTASAPATPAAETPAKSEDCPADRPWLCTATGPSAAPQAAGPRPAPQQPTRAAAPTRTQAPPPDKSAATAAKPDSGEAPLYIFGANDVVGVTVIGERDVSNAYTIMPDGRMSMPMIGSFTAIGMTVPELTEVIRTRLQEEGGILEPVVNVQLLRNNSKKYTVAGAVMRQGPVPLIQETTLMDALVVAGFTEFANKKKVTLRRGKKDYIFNYREALKGKGLDKNMVLQDGDYIIVAGD